MYLRNKKTGEVVDWSFVGPTAIKEYKGKDVLLERERYASIEEFISEYEDYTPAEPLIKDEKIRKAVRAWAEANDYGNDEVYEFEDFWTSWRSWSLEHRGDDNEIHFNGGIDFDKMNHRGTYTIAELCGEEEE